VARDVLGFRGAWAKVYASVGDPFVAEMLALRDAVIFAHARGFQRVVFEMDSQELVRCWLARSKERSLVAPILEEIILLKIILLAFRWFSRIERATKLLMPLQGWPVLAMSRKSGWECAQIFF
jgi:hypothetical protein